MQRCNDGSRRQIHEMRYELVGVLCLAFPLRPPGRPDAPSRLPELDAVTVPTLVVQGERDPFGVPPTGPRRTVVVVTGLNGPTRPNAPLRRGISPVEVESDGAKDLRRRATCPSVPFSEVTR